MASHYATDLSDDLESWKRDHEQVQECWKLEDKLVLFDALIEAFIRIVSPRFSEVSPGPIRVDAETVSALRTVVNSCSKIADIIVWFEQNEYSVEGASAFRGLQATVKMWLRITEAQSNPRPICMDDCGNLTEFTTGEPFLMPGLEPESILRGMADIDAGRVRSLEEILADRHQ